MSQQFLEALEILPEGSRLQPDFIRTDITRKSSAEIAEIRTLIEAIMLGLNYRLTKHTCYHEDGGACKVEVI